jgi:small subunit ribosomal protein S1
VVDTYNIGDELEGNVTKVVTFGAFVEILDGVEGLVHISELAQHHVDNPREIIQPGDPVRVKILEIDSERRRLSLSIKRVEGQVLPVRPIEPPADDGSGLDDVPELGLSEDVFAATDNDGSGTMDSALETAPEAGAGDPELTSAPEQGPNGTAEAGDAPSSGEAPEAAAEQPEAPSA